MRLSAGITTALVIMVVPLMIAHRTHAQAVDCTALANQQLPATTITLAQAVTTGSFTPPGATFALTNLPPFCRVVGTIKPTSDSNILFEVWLPLQGWNGRFTGVGNGGWAGSIPYGDLAEQIQRNNATAATNTGHEAVPGVNAARFAFEHPEQLIDFAHRAHHETAVQGKALVRAFYGRAPQHTYFIGCSSGGYEGLMEAQRYPADYDGIVAGAPASNFTRLMAGLLDAALALQDPGSNLSLSSLGLLHRAVLATCDKVDGVGDGLIEDPRRCRFDPAVLQCNPNQRPVACLTAAQVVAVRRVYGGLKDPTNGEQLFPGRPLGSEPSWPALAEPRIAISYYRWLVLADPNWNWRTFSFADPTSYQAFRKSESTLAPLLNATNPDLRAFRQRGGKLIQYHGWIDQEIVPQDSVDYYESVIRLFAGGRPDRSAAVEEVQSFYRLFMRPGVGHCNYVGSGPGLNLVDMQSEIEQWVERDLAPEQVIAGHSLNTFDPSLNVVDRLRPLCPYPSTATYKGQGDTNNAVNFVCRAP